MKISETASVDGMCNAIIFTLVFFFSFFFFLFFFFFFFFTIIIIIIIIIISLSFIYSSCSRNLIPPPRTNIYILNSTTQKRPLILRSHTMTQSRTGRIPSGIWSKWGLYASSPAWLAYRSSGPTGPPRGGNLPTWLC